MTMSKLEVDAILKEWRFYSDTIKRMLPGNTPALREASAKLGYPLMNAIPGLIERIDDQDRWLEHERNRAARLENQLDGTQKELARVNALVKMLQERPTVEDEPVTKPATKPRSHKKG